MSAKKWNFYYDEKKSRFTENNLVDTASLWIAIGLLWLSFLRIIEEHFPTFVKSTTMVYDTDSYMSASLVSKDINMDWFVIVLFLVCLWLPVSGFLSRQDKTWNRVCIIAGMVIPVMYIVTKFEKIVPAIQEIANQYLRKFNAYQGTSLAVPAGKDDFAPLAFTIVLMVLWMLIWAVACLTRKRIVLVLFPVCAIILELLVGLSPKGNGIFFLFAAAFLLLMPNGTKPLRQVVVVVAAVVSLFLAGVVFSDKITELSTDKSIVNNWIEQLKEAQGDMSFTLDFLMNDEQLSNLEPIYTGKTVFEMYMESPPESTLYLRGFYGNTYKNGKWTLDTQAFQQACREAGYSATEMGKVVSYMPYEFLGYAGDYEFRSFSINYVNNTGDTAYTPYVFYYDTLDEKYGLSGDYLLKKGLWDKKVTGTMLSSGDKISISQYNTLENLQEIRESDGYKYRRWYNKVAEAYAQSATKSKVIRNAAAKIENDTLAEIEFQISGQFGDMTYSEQAEHAKKNLERGMLVSAVKEYLSEQMSYSLKLDTLPLGADPVEYALTKGHEGYCMHYASAGALILKELGVPARYVSGYIVRTSDFRYDRVESLECARVPDYNAHAWVEVYYEDIGWIPCEMTEGYSSGSQLLPTQEDRDELEHISQENREEFEAESESQNRPSESEEELPSEDITGDTQEPESSENATEDDIWDDSQEEDSDSEEPGDVTPGGDLPQDKDMLGQVLDVVFVILKIFAVVGILAAGVAGILLVVKAGQRHYESVLEKEVKKNLTRRAIKRMNRRIYRVLRLRSPFMEKLTDRKYEKALMQVYAKVPEEDWTRYMEIVKKAHYSLEDISTEEMLHCYNCYKAR